jgi:hypothetical protein
MESDILRCCLKLITTGTDLQGFYVLAANEVNLIDKSRLPCVAIINSDPSFLPGTHWIALYIFKVRQTVCAVYFDSYANPIEAYKIEISFHIIQQSRRVLQAFNSSLCGVWCLAFIYYNSRRKPISWFENLFSCNLEQNDERVRSFYKKIASVPFSRTTSLSTQRCCARKLNYF